MQRVHKLKFEAGETELHALLPAGAPVIHFAAQGNDMCVWFIDSDGSITSEERHLSIRGTGHPIEDAAVYIDTAFLGPFVFHLFENLKKKAA